MITSASASWWNALYCLSNLVLTFLVFIIAEIAADCASQDPHGAKTAKRNRESHDGLSNAAKVTLPSQGAACLHATSGLVIKGAGAGQRSARLMTYA